METLTDIRAIKDFDVLGHIDYIVRYGKEKEKYYSYTKFSDEIDEILKYLIAHGKGIELNTAGFKYGLGFCHPHPDILKDTVSLEERSSQSGQMDISLNILHMILKRWLRS